MSIFEVIEQAGKEVKYNKNITEAQKIFNKQKQAIKNLKGTEGLTEIKKYWESMKELNENMYEEASMDKKPIYFALYKQSKQFLNFIENLSS